MSSFANEILDQGESMGFRAEDVMAAPHNDGRGKHDPILALNILAPDFRFFPLAY